MNRGAQRAKIFFDARCCDRFLELVGELPERYGMAVHGYCLMPNHFHLLLESRSARLSTAMGYLQRSYSSWLNRRYEWDGPLLRGRFRNRAVEDEETWRLLLAHIHLDPVRGGLASIPEEADWTSHGAYLGLAPRPKWLTVREMTELYGSLDSYREYLQELSTGQAVAPDGYDPDSIWQGPDSGIVRLQLEAAAGLPSQVPAWAEMDEDERVETALLEVQHVMDLARDEVLASAYGRRGNSARWITAWWLTWAGRVSGVRTSRVLGIRKSGVSQMAAKVRSRRGTDDQLDHWMTALEELYVSG